MWEKGKCIFIKMLMAVIPNIVITRASDTKNYAATGEGGSNCAYTRTATTTGGDLSNGEGKSSSKNTHPTCLEFSALDAENFPITRLNVWGLPLGFFLRLCSVMMYTSVKTWELFVVKGPLHWTKFKLVCGDKIHYTTLQPRANICKT